MTSGLLVGALKWEPNIKGALYVIIALVVLAGSGFLILSTNVGARLGFLLAAAGLFGWLTIHGAVWWVYGAGPKGRPAAWKAVETAQGDLTTVSSGPLAGYPAHWRKLDPADTNVADATGVVQGRIVGPKAIFKKASDFLVVGAGEKGGQTYGPFHLLNFRPFNVFHEAHYLIVQVQQAVKPPTVPGQPPPKATVDPQAPVVSVVTVRDLGALRENPAVVCLSSALLFGIICYQLHTRDKEAMARRAAAGAG
ncbi:MAG: hypothetical protein ACR2HY_02565 [Acidimicrobiales bacterium]